MREDLYEKVTATIIAQLESGVTPWARPWKTNSVTIKGGSIGDIWPKNYATKASYSGINVMIAWIAAQNAGYTDSRWLTYNQAKKINAQVRGGEKGTTLYYADRFVPKKDRGDENAKPVFFLKAFTVFNVAQIDGLPIEAPAAPVAVVTKEQRITAEIEAAQAIIAKTGAVIRHGGNRAYYQPSADSIQMPVEESFTERLDYYRTAFHELGHWTGHKSRLDRDLTGSMQTDTYAREELIAELAAAFVGAQIGVQPTTRHADYLGSWIKVLKEDSHAIFRAASAAQKAADFVLGRHKQADAPIPADPTWEVVEPSGEALAA